VFAVKRVLFPALFAVALFGCNTILGIDEATLDPDAATTGTGGGCSLMAPDPCNQCIAARCCGKYDACVANDDCKMGLSEYNVCVGVSFTNDAGGTCDEAFASSLNRLRSDLATCAFLNDSTSGPPGCAEKCKDKPVGGDICSSYCGCLPDTCQDKVLAGEKSCLDICGAFTEEQLACRPYHCGLAKQAKARGDEPGRQTHCGHSVGEALCP
jgi:hypothetical protein